MSLFKISQNINTISRFSEPFKFSWSKYKDSVVTIFCKYETLITVKDVNINLNNNVITLKVSNTNIIGDIFQIENTKYKIIKIVDDKTVEVEIALVNGITKSNNDYTNVTYITQRSVNNQCSGFFINKNGYICTIAHGILNSNITNNTFQLENKGTNYNTIYYKPSQIIIDVSNKQNNYTLEMEIVGFCLQADICILKPKEKIFYQIEHIKWGEPNKKLPGNTVYIIGTPNGIDRQSCNKGVIRDNQWSYYELRFECVVTNCVVLGGISGSPIFDDSGNVLAMMQFNYKESSYSGGISAMNLQFIVDKIIKNNRDYDYGWLGILTDVNSGLHLLYSNDKEKSINGQVVKTSMISKLPVGSVITHADGKELADGSQNPFVLSDLLYKKNIGDKITLTYRDSNDNWKIKNLDVGIIELDEKVRDKILPFRDENGDINLITTFGLLLDQRLNGNTQKNNDCCIL
jgi:S1-C subfamily serine protease